MVIMEFSFDDIKSDLEKRLKKKRYLHTLSVVEEGLSLNDALKLGFEYEKVALACLLHDSAKNNEKEYFELLKKSMD